MHRLDKYAPPLMQVLWINTAMKTMWPYYNQAVGQQVLEQVNPIIAEQIKPVRSALKSPRCRLHNAFEAPHAISGGKVYLRNGLVLLPSQLTISYGECTGAGIKIGVAHQVKCLCSTPSSKPWT